MKCIPSSALALVWLLAVASPAQAYFLDWFSPESCTWNATDIVVATEGAKIDGILTVQEVWKGSLKPGQQITIPELASFSHAAARRVPYVYVPTLRQVSQYVTGRRMVLYLARGRAKNGGNAWLPAPHSDMMETSLVWVEQGQVYQVEQEGSTEGPLMPTPTGMTEAQLRSTTQRVLSTKTSLYQVIATTDKERRARTLVPFTRLTLRNAQETAWRALGNCGPAAGPTLRAMLHAAYLPDNYMDIVTALTQAEGANAEPYLIHVVQEETAFWAGHTQDLPPNWWQSNPKHNRTLTRLLGHYDKALVALDGLRNLHATRCAAAVRAYRDLWHAHPPHHDRSGLYEMRRACADILNAPLL